MQKSSLDSRRGIIWDNVCDLELQSGEAFFSLQDESVGSGIALAMASDQMRNLTTYLNDMKKRFARDGATWKVVADAALESTLPALFKSVLPTAKVQFHFRPLPLKLTFVAEPVRIRLWKTDVVPSKTRVLIVDDSATIRNLLTSILKVDPEIEVAGAVESADKALNFVRQNKVDVMTLDIHMPGMDGVTFLERHGRELKIPVIMISSITKEEGNAVFRCLELGAIDYIQKPKLEELDVVRPLIVEKVKAARSARVQNSHVSAVGAKVSSFGNLDRVILAIGSSTGGTEAIRQLFQTFPSQIPPTVIVQHIPPVYSRAFAERLNSLFPFEVSEAQDGDTLAKNRVLIAPGATQMRVVQSGSTFRVKIDDSAPVNRHKPSVDVLFDSLVQVAPRQTVAMILTGMGADGARGLLSLRQAGAYTLAQDQASCVVYGMPRAAAELNAAVRVCSLNQMASALAEVTNMSPGRWAS